MKAIMFKSAIAVLAASTLFSKGVRAEDQPTNSQAAILSQNTNAPATSAFPTNSLLGFMRSLKKPIVLDQNPERRIAKKGRTVVDKVMVLTLKDGGETRFCVSFYGAYGEAWLKTNKHALLVLCPRPIEQYGWDGYAPKRGSVEEKELAAVLAAATGDTPKKYLEAAEHE